MELYRNIAKDQIRDIDDQMLELQRMMEDLEQDGILESEKPVKSFSDGENNNLGANKRILKGWNGKGKVKVNYDMKERIYDYEDINNAKVKERKKPGKMGTSVDQKYLLWTQNRPDDLEFLNKGLLELEICNRVEDRSFGEMVEDLNMSFDSASNMDFDEFGCDVWV